MSGLDATADMFNQPGSAKVTTRVPYPHGIMWRIPPPENGRQYEEASLLQRPVWDMLMKDAKRTANSICNIGETPGSQQALILLAINKLTELHPVLDLYEDDWLAHYLIETHVTNQRRTYMYLDNSPEARKAELDTLILTYEQHCKDNNIPIPPRKPIKTPAKSSTSVPTPAATASTKASTISPEIVSEDENEKKKRKEEKKKKKAEKKQRRKKKKEDERAAEEAAQKERERQEEARKAREEEDRRAREEEARKAQEAEEVEPESAKANDKGKGKAVASDEESSNLSGSSSSSSEDSGSTDPPSPQKRRSTRNLATSAVEQAQRIEPSKGGKRIATSEPRAASGPLKKKTRM